MVQKSLRILGSQAKFLWVPETREVLLGCFNDGDNVANPCQVLMDVNSQVLEAVHPLYPSAVNGYLEVCDGVNQIRSIYIYIIHNHIASVGLQSVP